MAKIIKNIVIIVFVISCASIAAGPLVKPTVKAKAKKTEPIEDPYKDSTILIEAFVAEVRLSALYDLGVSPIGEKPNSVSIDNILRCLQDEDNARIRSGAKVAVKQREMGRTETEQRIYLDLQSSERNKRASGSRPARPYQFGKTFDASANILAPNRIYVSFTYRENSMDKASIKNNTPPDTADWQWSGPIYLESGKASIVGATQDETKVIFLILCADIRGS